MTTYEFTNPGMPGVRITVRACQTEAQARIILELLLQEAEHWLQIDTVHEWELFSAY